MADEPFDKNAKRLPGPPEDYVRLALIAIEWAEDAEALREWWKDEAQRRRLYQLSPEDEQQLAKAAQDKVATLPQGKPTAKKKPTRPMRSLV